MAGSQWVQLGALALILLVIGGWAARVRGPRAALGLVSAIIAMAAGAVALFAWLQPSEIW